MSPAETPSRLDYEITVPADPDAAAVTVAGRLASLPPGRQVLRISSRYGAAGDLALIQDLGFQAGEARLTATVSGPGEWTVEHPGGPLSFHYRLLADPQAHGLTLTDPGYDELPQLDGTLFFAPGELILLRPEHLPPGLSVRLGWTLPPGWAALTPWQDETDLDSLLDNYLLAAPHTRPLQERIDGFAYSLIWPGREGELFSEPVRAALRRVFEAALEQFGGRPTRPRYQLIIKDIFQETAFAGSPKRDSIQLSVPRGMGGDELAGFQDGVWFRVLAHEFFHTWTSRAFAAGDPQAVSETYWLAEGFNDYLSLLALARAGILSPEDLVRTFHDRLLQQAAQGAGGLDLVAASRGFLDDPAARQRSYDLGSLVALELDLKLRQASAGHHSLGDFIALLIERGGVAPEDSAAVTAAWREFAPEPLREALSQAIHSPKPIDPGALLELMQVEARQSGQSLGFDALAEPREAGLCFVVVGEIAAGQGLRPGDCLLAVDGREATTADDLFMALTPDTATQLSIRRDQEILMLPVRPLIMPVYEFTIAPGSLVYSLTAAPD